MKLKNTFLTLTLFLSLFLSNTVTAQEKQVLDNTRFKVENIRVGLSNGETIEFSIEEFGGLMCGKGEAGLTVFWRIPKDKNGIQFYENVSKEYLFIRQLLSDKRMKHSASPADELGSEKGDGETDPSYLALENRMLNLEKMVAQLLKQTQPSSPPAPRNEQENKVEHWKMKQEQ